ncbi:LytTR family DNA-binding domain-containing protein [Pseudoduganella ginsengisoli]|uniref:Response regulator n=1 Tax=Pseudoduganella ginsengisoli TaxID=1462440 RepID=A0A6L6Q6I1_9BURK|nr:LytTR family DNA-binding domain-containing protein [Pseudoduganella ginsengisoli]MTW05205.1 response regulator [Pseudoduganella ginsengisoli]
MTTEQDFVKVLIADDEPVARAGLRHLLQDVPWLQCVGEAADGPAVIAAVQRLRPDVLLLDIQMPGCSGIDVLRQLPQPAPRVVFTTAYAEHAVTAFELGALDYLLKPFGAERLNGALARVRAALGEPLPPALDRYGEMLASGPMQRLFVRSGRIIQPVAVADVLYFDAVGDYVTAYTAGGEHLLHLALNRLEARLDLQRFVRIHRAHIVNLDHVARFRRELDGRLTAVMRNGVELPVSKAKAQVLRELAC